MAINFGTGSEKKFSLNNYLVDRFFDMTLLNASNRTYCGYILEDVTGFKKVDLKGAGGMDKNGGLKLLYVSWLMGYDSLADKISIADSGTILLSVLINPETVGLMNALLATKGGNATSITIGADDVYGMKEATDPQIRTNVVSYANVRLREVGQLGTAFVINLSFSNVDCKAVTDGSGTVAAAAKVDQQK